MAFPLLVLATTHSPAKAGLVGFAIQVPVLAFYLPAGVLVDRRDRRAIMVTSRLVGGLAMASVPIALALGRLAFGQILIVAFVAGVRQVLYSVAEQGALPLVVSPSQISEAVTGNQARGEAALLAGPPLGGILFGLARAAPFAVDAVSYLFSAVGARLVRTPLQEPRDPERGSRARSEIAEAMRWFWSQPFLRASALAVAATNFTVVAEELVLIIRARQHGASPAAVGVMLALTGLGGLIGAVLASQITRRVRSPVIVIGVFWLETVLLLPLVLTRNAYLLGAIVGIAAVGSPAWNAVVVGRLSLTPDHLRGRVISVARLISG